MKNNFEKIKQDIELIYLSFEEQQKKAGYIIGNSFFNEKQLSKLKGFKQKRESIWKQLESMFDTTQCFEIAGIIQDGFKYMADNGSVREYSKAYQDRKKKILDYVRKQNEQLIKKYPYFKLFPLQIDITPHHLDSPTKRGRPADMKNIFIKQLSNELKTHFQVEDQQAKFIFRIFRFFFGVPNSQTAYRNIRQQF